MGRHLAIECGVGGQELLVSLGEPDNAMLIKYDLDIICVCPLPQRPARGSLEGRVLLLDERQPVVLQVLGVDREVLVIPGEDPLDDLVVVGVPQLDLEPLGPSLEPAIGALHVAVAVGQVELPRLGLHVAGLGSVTTCLPGGETTSTINFAKQMKAV